MPLPMIKKTPWQKYHGVPKNNNQAETLSVFNLAFSGGNSQTGNLCFLYGAKLVGCPQ